MTKRKYISGWQIKVLAILLGIFVSGSVYAQFYNGTQMTFGKNRVQYEDFNWYYYRFGSYDVYSYLGGKELAIYVAKYAKEIIDRLELETGITLEDKLQFVVFNNFTDLKQSNIGLLNDERYNTGGITHIIGTKVVLYFDGSHKHLEEQIRAGVAKTLIDHAIYGTSLGAQIKNNSLFPFPEWFLSGLVSFYSKEWTTDFDDRVRDGIVSGRYDDFNKLRGEDARLAGHSFWYFIANTYGKENIANILYLAKMSRRVQNGFIYSLGKSLPGLIEEWHQYYQQRYGNTRIEDMQPGGQNILRRSKKNTVYQQLRISPDGKYLAYVSNQFGRYKVCVKDLSTGKRKVIYRGAYRLNEKVDYSYPILDWHPKGDILAFLVEKKGKPYMIYYSLKEKKKEQIYMSNFEKVLDFSYSDDGYFMAVSAINRGQSDIFVYDVGSNTYEQITFDVYDDRYPCFYHHDRNILFSSNRPGDTLRGTPPLQPPRVDGNFRLFMYDYQKRNPVLQAVTRQTFGDDIKPQALDAESFVFLGDENGIRNLYLGKLDSTINFIDTTIHYRYFTHTYPLSDFKRNILSYDVHKEKRKLAASFFINNRYVPLLTDIPDFSKLSETELKPTASAGTRNAITPQAETKTEKEEQSGFFYNVHQSDIVSRLLHKIDTTKHYSYQDLLNKKVDDSVYQALIRKFPEKNLLQSKKEKEEERLQRHNYYVEFFFNEVTMQLDFTNLFNSYQPFMGGGPIFPNSGVNGLFNIGLTDLMEDYRIVGGMMLNMNFKNNEYLFSYSDLKHRLDKEFIFHRKPNLYQFDYYFIRDIFHEFLYVLKYPFNEIMSLRTTFSYRNETAMILASDIYSLTPPNQYAHTGGLKGEFVFDNTRSLGTNLLSGTRAKAFLEYNQSYNANAPEKFGNLIVAGFDYRQYIKIHRNFILANRLAGSSSLGSQKLIYFMGGVDNWLFPKYNKYTPIDYSQGYYYQTLATNLRGFPQNIRNGNSFMVLNSELRFPVFNYFSKYPLNSEFLNNFQIIGFGDIGTAWTGSSPYSEDNFLYTNEIDHNPMHIKVKMVSDPVVGGYGFGIRSKLIGYFMRADLAWGVENMKIQKPVFYFSLSLDF